ncbi:MAG: sugar ABC transporter permease [Chloroflexi bacterium]|nr:sugar ABC transporter permease [Chloroflexota bacterium]MCI0576913.1 sugar ABC transporter permease [Chloroflexota bacterium]MCI0649699.1 sugar ABC transporter permease [Chloroflexota bacterium]MCI0729938.1 sugar ABC transporter permease [Chloroflexota bacterium]
MRLSSERRKSFPIHILIFLTPAVVIYTIFMIYPLVDSLRLSFFSQDAQDVETFAGLQNYIRLLTDPLWAPRFWNAFRNNLIFFAVHMLVQNPIGLLLAALLSRNPHGRSQGIYRTLIFTPTLLSVVIIGFIWQLILNPLWGIARGLLEFVRLGALFKPWLGLPETALVTLSLISVWQFVGIPMMLFYAALIGIPDELTEAARVDGASGWSIFWRIKFPLILPTVGIVSILTFVGNFNAFDLIYTVKGGLAGPDFASDIFGTLFYRTFFGFQLQLGNPPMGATVAAMMFLIILAGVLLYMVAWQRRVQSYEL